MPFKPAVSVIVPVYNVSEYIERCARSIFEQTINNLEIIFIDDCSPDNSINIIKQVLKEYPERKNQTKIIRLSNNKGSAAVRKIGILEAKSDYIIHCDGDDWIDNDLYENLYLKAINSNSDIVISDYILETNKGAILKTQQIEVKSGKEAVERWYWNSFHMACWNKLVKRSVLIDNEILPWDGLNMWEDNGLMLRVFYKCNRIEQIHNSFYHYNKLNTSALSSSYNLSKVSQMIDIAGKVTDFFKSQPDYNRFIKTTLALQFYAKIALIIDSFDGLKLYKKTFKESNKIIPYLNTREKGLAWRTRLYFVRLGMAPLFILLFKIYNSILKVKNR